MSCGTHPPVRMGPSHKTGGERAFPRDDLDGRQNRHPTSPRRGVHPPLRVFLQPHGHPASTRTGTFSFDRTRARAGVLRASHADSLNCSRELNGAGFEVTLTIATTPSGRNSTPPDGGVDLAMDRRTHDVPGAGKPKEPTLPRSPPIRKPRPPDTESAFH